MIYAAEARQQIAELQQHYERRGRLEASRALLSALIEAERNIEDSPDGRYWITCTLDLPPIILGVFYDEADIPGRL